MTLSIITPTSTLFKGECKLVQMPGIDGLFEMLDNHAPIVALLRKGTIKIQESDGKNLFFDIESGIVKASNNKAEIMVCEI